MNIHKIYKYVHSQDKTLEWYDYSLSYLMAVAEIANNLSSKDVKKEPDFYLLIPIIFNLRHGIELLLKFITLAAQDLPKKNHDITELFLYVRKILSELDDETIQHASVSTELKEKNIRVAIETLTQATERIVNKYKYYSFLSEDGIAIDDHKNELFRYPSIIENKFKLDLSTLRNKITVDEIKEDVDFLIKFLFIIVFVFGKKENGTPILF